MLFGFRKKKSLPKKSLRYRHYSGASANKFSPWPPPAQRQPFADLPALRERSHDLIRNSYIGRRIVDVLTANVIGSGIKLQTKPEVEKTFNQWSKNPHACDFDSVSDFVGLQSLVFRVVVQAGGCFVRKIIDPKTQAGFRLQVLEPDHLDTSKHADNIRYGIEWDGKGRKKAYWLFPQHPHEQHFRSCFDSIRIPIQDCLHVYRVDRPGQLIGVPWLAPVMIKIKDLDTYDQAQLIKQKVSAAFAGFRYSMDSGSDPMTDQEIEEFSHIEPGTIQQLALGEQITFANPPKVEDYSQFASQVLRSIAAGLGLTYEALTGDLSQVNFSSARMGWLEFSRQVSQWQKQIMVAKFLNPVFQWFCEINLIPPPEAIWTPPRREMIEPLKEVQAQKEAVAAGFRSRREIIQELGGDYDQVNADMKADNFGKDDSSKPSKKSS